MFPLVPAVRPDGKTLSTFPALGRTGPKAVLEAGPTGAYRQAPAGRCLVGWAGGPAAAVGPASLIACLAGQAPI